MEKKVVSLMSYMFLLLSTCLVQRGFQDSPVQWTQQPVTNHQPGPSAVSPKDMQGMLLSLLICISLPISWDKRVVKKGMPSFQNFCVCVTCLSRKDIHGSPCVLLLLSGVAVVCCEETQGKFLVLTSRCSDGFKLNFNWNQTWILIQYGTLYMLKWSNIIN